MKNYKKIRLQIENMLDYAVQELRSEAEYSADAGPFHGLQLDWGREGVHIDVSCERDGLHVVIIEGPGRIDEYINIETYAENRLNARACEQDFYYAAQRGANDRDY